MPEKPKTNFWMTLSRFAQIFLRPRTLQQRLMRIVGLLVFIPSLAIVMASAIVGRQVGQQQAIDQLNSVASLKQGALEKWILDTKYDMVVEIVSQPLGLRLKTLLNSAPGAKEYDEAYTEQVNRLAEVIAEQKTFSELFLLDTQGNVVLSTSKGQVKKNYANEVYFQKGLQNVFVSTPIYDLYELSQGTYSIILSQPVVFEGETLGVFAGRVSLAYANSLLSERAGLGETGETYLIDVNYATPNTLLHPEADSGRFIRTLATNQVIQNQAAGSGLYRGYYGEGVIGVYKWLPELQMGLVAEQTQAEAFRATTTILWFNVGVTLIALILATWMALIFGRNLGQPIKHLANIAGEVAAGNLKATAPMESEDEIGLLATAFNSMTAQLRTAVESLEERVHIRTTELELANQQTQRNANELKIISEVSRTIASEQNIEKLLPLITHLISERFGFYHVGIFLLDETRSYAILRAANSRGGQRMLARQHKLEVGLTGIVGYVAQKGQPRIALDTGADITYFNNPDLPETRSEMALPLNLRGKIIGVLDVQSTQPAAFTEDDTETLGILAEQVAVAIDNARLFNESRLALLESQKLYQQFVSQAWGKTSGADKQAGYFQSLAGGQSLEEPITTAAIEQALQKGAMVIGSGEAQPGSEADPSANVTIPIKLREQIVGVLSVRSVVEKRTWTQNELGMVQAISDRVAFALENARLLEESQRRAARERAIGEISTRISSAADVDEILRATVDELGKKLVNAEISIEIGNQA